MKLKSILCTFIAFGAMALMAVGAQAATYSAGALVDAKGSVDGTGATQVTVPVYVTPDADEASVSVNGYAMSFTYNPGVVTPVATTDTDSPYATVDSTFDNGTNNSVIVSAKKTLDDGREQVIVAWAAAQPVSVDKASAMASVDFTVVDTAAQSADVAVQVVQLTNDGATIADATAYTVADGVIDLANDVVYLVGDVNGNGEVNSLDTALLKRLTSNIITLDEMNAEAEGASDRANINGDAEINSLDTALLLRYTSNLISYEELLVEAGQTN